MGQQSAVDMISLPSAAGKPSVGALIVQDHVSSSGGIHSRIAGLCGRTHLGALGEEFADALEQQQRGCGGRKGEDESALRQRGQVLHHRRHLVL